VEQAVEQALTALPSSHTIHHRNTTGATEDKEMAKVLRCRDVGVDCDFVASGATVEEVMQKAKEHACTDHGFAAIPPELAEKVKAAIRDEETASA
jgi:predicted small metal-binding protein